MTSGPGRAPGEVVATVSGSAYAEAAPDRARLHLRVEVAESSARGAADAFAVALAGARSMLDELGCTYTVGSVVSWEGGPERRSRHRVWCDVAVVVTDLALLSGLVERVLQTSRLSIAQLQWELSNLRELRRQARVKAIAEAREAAEDYAQALGLRLGAVRGVSDAETGGMRPMMAGARFSRAAGAEADRPEIDLSNAEPVRVDGTVVLTFGLE